ncbi:hypothetical protein DICVIV_13013 [Dictyocaulus viviparus]|uniref:Calponin-homology (CH) domain-containing protein n=1 Tax=Dictyocaulus viviparus TaxID=29172 RepID=A0A0D8XB68_DICVI|nr:hypothetical protein DICVIV_13013 [Dictyocaulus viviparus]
MLTAWDASRKMVRTFVDEYSVLEETRILHQVQAMSAWCNEILKPHYIDQNRDVIRQRATRLFNSSDALQRIRAFGESRMFISRADCDVYSNLALQATLLRVFLSFHPVWLQLGLETIFQTEISLGNAKEFPHIIGQFIQNRLFSETTIINNETLVHVGNRSLLTDAGRKAMNSRFIVYTLLFLYFVELAISESIFDNGPPMFTQTSEFKNYSDEHLSIVKTLEDLTDGVVLGYIVSIFVNYTTRKIIELISGCAPRSLLCRLCDPRGRSWRKILNVKICLQVAAEQGLYIPDVDLNSLVSGKRDVVLKTFWTLAKIYICNSYLPKLQGYIYRSYIALRHVKFWRECELSSTCCAYVSSMLQYITTSLSAALETFSPASIRGNDRVDIENERRRLEIENCINELCNLTSICEHFHLKLSRYHRDVLKVTINLLKTL